MHWLTRLFQKQRAESQLDRELQFHLERQVANYVASGVAPEEARRRARLEFGGLENVKEECRESRRANLLDTLWQDVRFGLRLLRKSPGFTAVAVLTLALGIGANTAVFSIVNAVILRPLPLKDSSRLVEITTKTPIFPTFDLGDSWPAYQHIHAEASALEESAVYQPSERALTGEGDPALLEVAGVSEGFFSELGGTVQSGRLFSPAEYQHGQGSVAIISDNLWRARFGSDHAILGRTLVLDKQIYTIVGVASPQFDFPSKNDIWTPISLSPEIEKQQIFFALTFIGKLHRGVTIQQLNTELATIAARMSKDTPELSKGFALNAKPLIESKIESSRVAFFVLLSSSTLVLLIACANLASLLLARGSSRGREMAVRSALGASPARLLRQGLIESCLVALVGGSLAVFVAACGVKLFRLVAPADTPRLAEISVDYTILWFSLITSFIAGVLFGLAPAARAARLDPQEALKEGSGASLGAARSARQSRLGSTLVVVEVALAFILLIGSALMTRTLYNLLHQNLGFRTDHLLTFDFPIPTQWDSNDTQYVEKQAALTKQIMEQIQRVPGVVDVTASDHGLITGMSMMHSNMQVEGAVPAANGAERSAISRYVYPSYFRTMGIPLLRGRGFTEHDAGKAPAVVIVNETMARAYWGAVDVLGKRVSMSLEKDGKPAWQEVVGVVSDSKEVRLGVAPKPEYYLSMLQGSAGSMHFFVRTAGDPNLLAGAITRQIWSQFPDQPLTQVSTLSFKISDSVGDQRLRSILLVIFAAIGFGLALLGIYGVLSYSVARRVQEMGIRMALGASQACVMRMIIRQGLILVAMGVAIGSAAALGLVRLIASQFFGVKPTDPATFVGAIALVFLVALVAAYIPARRAMRVDPLVALRYE